MRVVAVWGGPEDEPEREDALPWEFANASMKEFQDEVKSLVLKLSLVRAASHPLACSALYNFIAPVSSSREWCVRVTRTSTRKGGGARTSTVSTGSRNVYRGGAVTAVGNAGSPRAVVLVSDVVVDVCVCVWTCVGAGQLSERPTERRRLRV